MWTVKSSNPSADAAKSLLYGVVNHYKSKISISLNLESFLLSVNRVYGFKVEENSIPSLRKCWVYPVFPDGIFFFKLETYVSST